MTGKIHTIIYLNNGLSYTLAYVHTHIDKNKYIHNNNHYTNTLTNTSFKICLNTTIRDGSRKYIFKWYIFVLKGNNIPNYN